MLPKLGQIITVINAARNVGEENNTGSSLAVHARTAGRTVSHLGMFVFPSSQVSSNGVITILFHEKTFKQK